MRALILLRHGQAVPAGPGPDFDRPLTAHGQRQAWASALHLRALSEVRPIELVTSPARRAHRTAIILNRVLTPDTRDLHRESRIYDAALSDLLDVLADYLELGAPLAIVGHNPGLTHLLRYLCPGRSAALATGTAVTCRLATGADPLVEGGSDILDRFDP